MIIRVIGNESVYLDEMSNEFNRIRTALLGFFFMAGSFLILLPLTLVIGMPVWVSGCLTIGGCGISIGAIVYSFTMPNTYYDVWISGEHRNITKTNTDADKISVQKAADELEVILYKRIKFARDVRGK
jgi:hypothetical protein